MSETPIVPSAPDTFPPLEVIKAEPTAAPMTPFALFLVVIAIPIAALVIGGIWHFVAYLADFPLVFPIFAGCGAGWAVGTAMKTGKAKSYKWAAWFGLAAALLTMLSRHMWDAYSERPLMAEAILSRAALDHASTPLPVLRRTVEETLTPWNTLRLHMEVRAHVGSSLKMYSQRVPILLGQQLRLRGVGYWILLLLETAVAGFAGALIAESFALRRYCPECGKSLKPYLLFQRKADQLDAMLSLTKAQNWDELKSLPKEKQTEEPCGRDTSTV